MNTRSFNAYSFSNVLITESIEAFDLARAFTRVENELVAVGISLGYQDEDAIINTVRQSRLSFDEFVTIHE